MTYRGKIFKLPFPFTDLSGKKARPGWLSRWDLEKAIDSIIEWTRALKGKKDLREMCYRQINEYELPF